MRIDQKTRCSGKTAITLLLLLGGAYALLHGTIQKQALAMKFPVEELRKYEGLFRGTGPDGRVPPRTGKVILVKPSVWSVYREGNRVSTRMTPRSRAKAGGEVEPPRIDDNFFSLPAEMRASSPDEVDTVILCEYGQTPWDPYANTGLRLISIDGKPPRKLYIRLVRFLVYDRRTGRCLGRHVLQGPLPKRSGDYYVSGTSPDVVSFVERMPLR